MLRKTVLSLKSPTGAFIAPLRCANANLFNKVQEKLAKNKMAPARHKAEESYLLTTKLYCGKCGALMFGESGVSHTGKMYTYYKCAAAKKKKTCDKKAVRKQWLEDLVVNETMKLVEDDASMNAIYLYDDKVLITFNYKEGTETVAFGEAVKAEKSSDMSARGAPDIERQIVRFGVLFCYVTPKNRGLHGQCTVFARSAFSWESSAWAGIALKCVVNFASGQQSQTELRLYFGVCILQQFQQSSHRDGRFACGGYSLRAGAFGLSIETFLDFLPQFYTRGLLDMSVGVHQHIWRSVSSGSLNSLHIAAGDHQLVGGTGVLQTVEHDLLKLRVLCPPYARCSAAPPGSCR